MPAAQDCASAILVYAPPDIAVTLVAIAGAESAFGQNPWGDATGGAYSCRGYTSIGAWQINMPSHYPFLQQQTGSNNPCTWANWLLDLNNNAKAAGAVYQSQGLGAWTTYKNGAYRQYLAQAQQAVAAVSVSPVTPASPPSPLPLLFGLGASAAVLGIGWWLLHRQPVSLGYMSRRELNPHVREDLADFLEDMGGGTWHQDIDTHIPEELSGFLEDVEQYQPGRLPFDGRMGADRQNVTYFRNLLSFDAARGVRVRDRDLPSTFDEVLFGAYNPDTDVMVLNSSIASEDNHALQTLVHETSHSLLHNHHCLPVGTPEAEYHGTYETTVEEREADLSVALVFSRLGLPLEMYDGEILPAKKWRLTDETLCAKTDAETCNRVKWAAGVMEEAVKTPFNAVALAAGCPIRRVAV